MNCAIILMRSVELITFRRGAMQQKWIVMTVSLMSLMICVVFDMSIFLYYFTCSRIRIRCTVYTNYFQEVMINKAIYKLRADIADILLCNINPTIRQKMIDNFLIEEEDIWGDKNIVIESYIDWFLFYGFSNLCILFRNILNCKNLKNNNNASVI